MWSVVMFDLPVQTRKQRGEAAVSQHLLLNLEYRQAHLVFM